MTKMAFFLAALLVAITGFSAPTSADSESLLFAQYIPPEKAPSAPEGEAAPPVEQKERESKGRNPAGALPVPKPRAPTKPEGAQGPAYREECIWIGERILGLLARDDAMTANDFMPFYQRFECPGDHLGKAFGCVVSNGELGENEALRDRVQQCWGNPSLRFPSSKPAATDSSANPPAEKPSDPPKPEHRPKPEGGKPQGG